MSELALQRIREAKEKRLTRLDLGNCGLTELPDELFELTWLEELNLGRGGYHLDMEGLWQKYECENSFKENNIQFLPIKMRLLTNLKVLFANGPESKWELNDITPLSTLRNLEVLYLFGTNIFDINPLKNLNNLVSLSLSETYVSDLSPLENLLNLKQLYICETNIQDLSPLSKLKNLRHLLFWETSIRDLTPLTKFKKLEYLDISGTQINDLKPLTNLSNLKILLTDSCPIINPPLEVVNRGFKSICEFFEQIEKQKGVVELYEAKLIIVGEGGTGKTSLFEKLKDNTFSIQNIPETHGINIHEGLEFTHEKIDNKPFNANLWDFGGQELQYMTHQFFLTPRALYVLMMDARRESPNLAYWFKIISLLGRDSQDSTEKVRLLLVFNKRGNSTGLPPQYQDQLKYYEDSLEVQYLEVDLAENDFRFDALQKTIQHSLVTLPIVKSQLPRLWKVVREDLREEAKKESYITTRRYSELCSKHGITEEADQWLLSGYLHQLGSLLHFQNDRGLRSYVILSPQWAVDGVYTFLSDEDISRNNGRFTEEAFIKLLATKKYNPADADLILQLMTKNNFDICYEATEGNYVAAQLLPDNRPPQYFWEKRFGALQFRFQYPIMPKGLMSRLIVRLSDYIEKVDNEQVVWKKGAILNISTDKNNPESACRVLMYEDDAESKSGLRQIIFEVMGTPQTHRKHALHRVREEVESLHKKWFRSIKPDEMIPCCCSECIKSDTPQLFKLENLLKRRLKRNDTSCDISGEDLLIQQLLEGVYDKNEIREMENQGRY